MEKLYGTTLLIGVKPLEIKYGVFQAYVYQDIIDKKYIIALVYGVLTDDIYVRIHSSCLTSETLRSMDCDCVEQLDGALCKIVTRGSGVLFYLLQSGRGASYIAKSRGCQLVQYLQDSITTFEAYEQMGLKHDYRDYRNVKEICCMLNIDKCNFILMTNNPDKINKLTSLGLKLKEIVSIEYEPNQFNQKYLISKQNTGHLLIYTKTKISNYKQQPSIPPFKPYHITDAKRFIHCSSYYLPIKPVDNCVVVSTDAIHKLDNLIINSYKINDVSYLVQLKEIPNDQCFDPYWFIMNVYYDIANHEEVLILTYGDTNIKTPIIRIHTEFIFNRFPLKDTFYQRRYEKALLEIVKNGSGIIAIQNHNGNNHTLGKYILNNSPFETTGISTKKNLLPIMLLLKHHIKNNDAKVFYANRSKQELKIAFGKAGINVIEWIFSESNDNNSKSDPMGHSLIKQKINEAVFYVSQITHVPSLKLKGENIIVTGVGSSQPHGEFLISLINTINTNINIKFYNLDHLINNNINFDTLIIISQGLSPHIIKLLDIHKNKQNIILITSVTRNNKDEIKQNIINNFTGQIINFPLEDEYDTLVRTIGPMCCFTTVYSSIKQTYIDNLDQILNSIVLPPNDFIDDLINYSRLIIVSNVTYINNLKYKFIEGGFLQSVETVNFIQLGHGVYQWSEHHRSKNINCCYLIINGDDKIINFLGSKYKTYSFKTKINNELNILEIEHLGNLIMGELIIRQNIDQRQWVGKDDQDVLYEV